MRQYAAGASLERELAAWLANCRCRYRGGSLKPEKAQELHALGCEGFSVDDLDKIPPKNKINEKGSGHDTDMNEVVGIHIGHSDVPWRKPDPPAEMDLTDGGCSEATPSKFLGQQQRGFNLGGYEVGAVETKERPSSTVVTSTLGMNSNKKGASAGSTTTERKQRKRKTFDERLVQLLNFYKSYGHFQVLTRGEHSDLGRWLSNTRTKVRDGKLAPELMAKFQAVLESGGNYIVDTSNKKEGDGMVSRRSSGSSSTTPVMTDEDHHYHHEDANLHTEESVLKSPGSSRKNSRAWEDSFQELVQFKNENGHCAVRIQKGDKYESLGRWLASNRCRFKMGQLQADKAQRLQEIGCTGFEEEEVEEPAVLTLYNAMHGSSGKATDSLVVRRPTIDPYSNVGVSMNALIAAADEMDEDSNKKRKFDSGDSVTTFESDTERAGPLRQIPSTDTTLGLNESEQQPSRKKRRLPPRQTFDEMLEELIEFQEKHGVNASVPKPEGDEGKLGRWLAFQRRQYLAGKLRLDRVEALHATGRHGFDPALMPAAGSSLQAQYMNDGEEEDNSAEYGDVSLDA